MLELSLPRPRGRATRILCLGAHGDDIEIGCGGTLLKLLAAAAPCEVSWVVFAADERRAGEVRASARRFLARARATRIIIHDFRDSYFPAEYGAIKDSFVALRRQIDPDLVFTHQHQERHQDHRLIGELTWNAFRDHPILEYEVPKFEGGLTTPNLYVSLTRAQLARKCQILSRSYRSQASKPWFTTDTFQGLARLRGVESGSAGAFAEGFHAYKLRLGAST